MMKFRNLYCITGPSGVGKTTLVNKLCENLQIQQVRSYTTRPPRVLNEQGHIFVSPGEFHSLGVMCAYTKRGNVEYGVTEDMLDQSQIYVIDPPGIEYLKRMYTNKKIKVIGLTADKEVLISRMIRRGDSAKSIQERLEIDANVMSPESLFHTCDVVVPSRSVVETLDEVKSYILGCELTDWIAI